MKKNYAAIVALAGGLLIGEYTQPYTSITESVRFHDVPVAKNFPTDPWNYQVQRELVEQDGKVYQGLYLVNVEQGIHKKISEDGCTCGIDNTIDELVRDVKEWVGEKVELGKNWVSGTYDKLTEDE